MISKINENLSEYLTEQTPHQQNELWSWKSSELCQDKTSRYARATEGSRFIFYHDFSNNSKVIVHYNLLIH